MSTAIETLKGTAGRTSSGGRGPAPLRPGHGHSFFWRRLHSLSGIVPIGVFLIEHYVSNAAAEGGPHAYALQVKFLNSLPFVFLLELFGIWIPLAYHAGYGIWIWLRGSPDLKSYPETSNWLYSAQRWTGIIVLAYIVQHVYTLRFSGIHLPTNPGAAFAKVQEQLLNPWMLAFYVIGIVCASWHFGYGIFLFCAKWGIVTGASARKKLIGFSIFVFLVMAVMGLGSLSGFLNKQYRSGANLQYLQDSLTDTGKAKAIEQGTDPMSQQKNKEQNQEQTEPRQP
ncbi:MAG: succinate dehydrogenase [Acidobacteriaceae bacterium]